MSQSYSVLRSSVAILLVAAIPALAAPSRSPAQRSVSEYLSDISRAGTPASRDSLKAAFLFGIRFGEVPISTSQEALAVTKFMIEILQDDTSEVRVTLAAEFEAAHAHPAAADALLRFAEGRDNGRNFLARRSAMQALVSLHDRRVLPLLVMELEPRLVSDVSQALSLIGDLGDPAGIPPIRAFLADSSLYQKYVAIEEDRARRFQLPTDRATSIASREAERNRAAAQRALANLERTIRTATVCPFDLPDSVMDEIERHGIAIVPSQAREMYELYDEAYPFVTSDVVLHALMVMVRSSLSDMDMLVLRPRLESFTSGMMLAALERANEEPNTEVRELAANNAAFFAVPAILLGANPSRMALPAPWRDRARGEVDRIVAHTSVGKSTILDQDEDFTKYRPRGRYASSPESGAFFRAMLYLGRMTFRATSTRETGQAALMVETLARHPDLERQWVEMDSLIGALYGQRDDLSFPEYRTAGVAVRWSGNDWRGDIEQLQKHLERMPSPRVNGAVTLSIENAEQRAMRTKGLRIFGQRYTRAADVLQQLLDAGRWPPTGVAVASVLLGSSRATELTRLDPKPAVKATPDPFASLPEGVMHATGALFAHQGRLPAFMHGGYWEDKQINTALGAWAEVSHATALFIKDANVYMGMSAMTDRFHGYVEPIPGFFARLDSVTRRLAASFEACGLFEAVDRDRDSTVSRLARSASPSDPRHPTLESMELDETIREARIRADRKAYGDLSEILERCESLARKELRGEAQSIDDGMFLKRLGYRFKSLAFNQSNANVAHRPMAVVTDVATEYYRQECFEVGVGAPAIIYVAVPDSSRTYVCRGTTYTYYEFTQPANHRLDDNEWHAMLAGSNAPSPWLASRPLGRFLTRGPLGQAGNVMPKNH